MDASFLWFQRYGIISLLFQFCNRHIGQDSWINIGASLNINVVVLVSWMHNSAVRKCVFKQKMPDLKFPKMTFMNLDDNAALK